MAKPPGSFVYGDEVEVICQDEGFKNSLYEARVVRSMPKHDLFRVEYETLVDEADPPKRLRETFAPENLRPRPPPVAEEELEIGEIVDAFHNDGWWVGEISKVGSDGEGGRRYAVRFPSIDGGGEEEREFGGDEIRVHVDWIDGKWVSPRVSVEGLRQFVAGKKRAIKRSRHQKQRMMKNTVESEGIELKQPEKKHDVRKANEPSNGGCGAKLSKPMKLQDGSVPHCAPCGKEPHNESPCPFSKKPNLPLSASHGKEHHEASCPSSERPNLPFSMISPIWKHLESSEVFSMLPQEPHFLPLNEYPEVNREGMAIGLMVTFSNFVNSIRKLKIVDLDDTLSDMMKTLVDLEEYGFNMQRLRALLEKLQTIKENQKQLLNRRSTLEGLILDRQIKKGELDAKADVINKIVVKLEWCLKYFHDEEASIKKQWEDNGHEVVKLQDDMTAVEESFLSAERSFLDILNAAQGSFANTC